MAGNPDRHVAYDTLYWKCLRAAEEDFLSKIALVFLHSTLSTSPTVRWGPLVNLLGHLAPF